MGRFKNNKKSKGRVSVKPIVTKNQANVDHVTGDKIPESFVFSRMKLPGPVRQLQMDLRKLMLPYTALSLKEKKRNTLRDFLNVAGPMGVTHFLMLTKKESSLTLRVARTPQGPTLTFKIHQYSLASDIAQSQLRPRCPQDLFKDPPLIVIFGFGSEELHLRLATVMFQNIFPAIDINTPVGVSRRIRKFVQNHQVSDLRNLQDVSDFITKAGYGSESEGDEEAATVTLSSDLGRVNRSSTKSAVKLQEIGPRMTMQLVKVEEGLCSGKVSEYENVDGKKSKKKEDGDGDEDEEGCEEEEEGEEDSEDEDSEDMDEDNED